MNNYVSIGEAAEIIGVTENTLRRWEQAGRLIPQRTPGGHRRYDLDQLLPYRYRDAQDPDATYVYFRMTSRDSAQKLMTIKNELESVCRERGYQACFLSDVDEDGDPGHSALQTLVKNLSSGKVGRLVIPNWSVFSELIGRFIRGLCEKNEVELVVLNRRFDDFEIEMESHDGMVNDMFCSFMKKEAFPARDEFDEFLTELRLIKELKI